MRKAKYDPKPETRLLRKNTDALARGFFDALQETQKELQQSVAIAVRKFALVPQEVHEKARRELIEAVNTYVDALRSAFGEPDMSTRIDEALRNYNAGIQLVVDHAQKRVAVAVQEYIAQIGILPEQARKGVESAYARYLLTLGQTFLDRDVEREQPETLAAVAQSMLVVAASARTALAN